MNLIFVFELINCDLLLPVVISVNSKDDFPKLYKFMHNEDLRLVNIINMG